MAPSTPPLPAKPPVYVEHGPEWLADLLYFPPWWLKPFLFVIVVVVIVLAAWGYHRHGAPVEVRLQMLENGLLVGTIALAAYILTEYASFPYVLDVLGSVIIGWVVLAALRRWGQLEKMVTIDDSPE